MTDPCMTEPRPRRGRAKTGMIRRTTWRNEWDALDTARAAAEIRRTAFRMILILAAVAVIFGVGFMAGGAV